MERDAVPTPEPVCGDDARDVPQTAPLNTLSPDELAHTIRVDAGAQPGERVKRVSAAEAAAEKRAEALRRAQEDFDRDVEDDEDDEDEL